jgi:hypothetical protein
MYKDKAAHYPQFGRVRAKISMQKACDGSIDQQEFALVAQVRVMFKYENRHTSMSPNSAKRRKREKYCLLLRTQDSTAGSLEGVRIQPEKKGTIGAYQREENLEE